MSALAITVPLGTGQTPTSFASCLAAANGIPAMRDFCRHMDIRLDRLMSGSLDDLDRLAEIGNADPARLASSWIVSKKGTAFVGGEKLPKRLVRSPFRFCPACLQDDIANRSGPVHARPFLRAAWSVHAVGTCIAHGTALVFSSRPVEPYLRDDFAAYVRRYNDEIEALAEAAMPLPPSAADRWMVSRLTNHADQGFLGSLHFHVAVRLCEMIGAVILFGLKAVPGKLTEADLRAAREKGYEIVSGGIDSIRSFLATLDVRFWETAHATGGVMLYGPLYSWLQGNSKNPDCEPVRDLVKTHVIDTLPIGPGDIFLGTVERRRWHSVHSAAKEYELHPKRLRKVLAEKGIIGTDHAARPDHRIVFEAASAAGFLDRGTKSVPAPVCLGDLPDEIDTLTAGLGRIALCFFPSVVVTDRFEELVAVPRKPNATLNRKHLGKNDRGLRVFVCLWSAGRPVDEKAAFNQELEMSLYRRLIVSFDLDVLE